METQKIKSIFAVVFVLLALQAGAQKIWEERTGCLSAQGNLAPGYLFAQKSVSAYVDGDIQVFINNKVAITGAAWVSFATNDKSHAGLRANHAIFWGAEYHFLKPSRIDPFISFTPGLGLVRASYLNAEDVKLTPFAIVPLMGLSIGCNYYVGSVFHFFVKVQGVAGQVFSSLPAPARLDEIKFMAGLGFNLRAWKPKHHHI